MKSYKAKKLAFTLIELIIVIAIIAILAVTAFLVLTKWLGKSRDSRRLNDLSTLDTALQLYLNTNNVVPKPDSNIIIYVSGTTNVVGYQGLFTDATKASISNINSTPIDPVDNINYVYYVDSTFKNYQMLGFSEQTSSVFNSVNAIDYSKRYLNTRGTKLGILLSGDNMPLNLVSGMTGVDLSGLNLSYKIVFDNNNIFIGTGKQLLTLAGIYNKDIARYDPSLNLYLDMKTTVGSGSEKVLKDFSSGGNNASCVFYTNGQPDVTLRQKCQSIDGYLTNDGVKFISGNAFMVANPSSFDISTSTGGITACAWHKAIGSADLDRSNLIWRNGSNKGFGLVLNKRNGVFMDINADYGNNAHTNFGTTLINNRILSCGVRAGGNAKLYVNGQKVSLQGGYDNYSITYANPTSSMPYILGAANRDSAGFMNGYMDDIHIYNRGLSDQEISALYNVGRN